MSMRTSLRSLVPAAAYAAACTLAAGTASAQVQQGTIAGRVTDAATGQPVASVQLQVVGTNAGTQTNADGNFTIRNLAAGTYTVRALRVGFAEASQSVRVSAGGTATANFQMRSVPTTLTPVVTTATGEQRRVEVGNAIAQVDAAKTVQQTAVANVADLLTARAPGVLVIPPTQTGAGTRVRIRGTSSLSLSNNPIYVIDGIRVEGTTGSTTVSVGGTEPSRVNDINPEEIQSIEVVRGPSAATLYGTDAANGVIVITTKKGVAGKARYTLTTEQGAHADLNDYPTAWRGWRTDRTTAANNSTASNAAQCFLSQVANKACAQDSVTSYNLYDDPDATPNGLGYRQQYNLQVGGGSEQLRYFLHGEWEDETGVLKVPEFDRRYLQAHGLALRPEEEHPNHLGRITGRSNFNMSFSPKFDLALNGGYTQEDIRLPMSDDSGVNGVAGNTYGGPGFKYNLSATGDTLFGWRQFTPRDVYQTYTNQNVHRVISSANANYRPAEWLAGRANFGVDYINRVDAQLCRFASCPDLGGDSRKGFKEDNRTNFFTYTADASATATKSVTPAIVSKTTAGVQYNRGTFDRNGAKGTVLAPGAVTITGAATKTADESFSETRTLGGFVEENLAFNERFYLTGAARSDRNSAFGADFKTAIYPKLSASWVLSDEPFFPKLGWLSQLRLRSAYGASGVQPGTIDAVRYYSASTARLESGDATGLVFSTLGNSELKPERSAELEVGFDGTYWNGRLTTEFTYYSKSSKDALISRILPPSNGTGATSRLENLGEVTNKGWEALVSATPVQSRAFGWDVSLNGSSNENKLVTLGGVPNIVTSSTQQQREGYPLYGWWSRAILDYGDKNGDGLISYNADPNLSEVVVSDTARYLGNPLPRVELALTNGFTLFRNLRLGAMIDYKGKFKLYNNTERIRCLSRNNCSGLVNPHSSLFEQARTVAGRDHPSRTVAGFIEDGDFIRFRELNLSYQAPASFAARYFRGRSLAVTGAVRNLGILWTKYTGVDPEAFGTTGNAPSEFQAFGPPTYFSLRFSLGF